MKIYNNSRKNVPFNLLIFFVVKENRYSLFKFNVLAINDFIS